MKNLKYLMLGAAPLAAIGYAYSDSVLYWTYWTGVALIFGGWIG